MLCILYIYEYIYIYIDIIYRMFHKKDHAKLYPNNLYKIVFTSYNLCSFIFLPTRN